MYNKHKKHTQKMGLVFSYSTYHIRLVGARGYSGQRLRKEYATKKNLTHLRKCMNITAHTNFVFGKPSLKCASFPHSFGKFSQNFHNSNKNV